ncbi:amylo-alpha-1,6-glucosidase [Actinokineospora bangkokensis]|uniref:Mannosylglycerate hydrolase MGH1-like glycoside hydrolase domain-containing protein n=1 Tax=Actinokineospora bangkokensis TaxID=1193682 RepID=A0A1Q9LGT8_9PSEU|nr:amylo-alpha-1,6-glucosidase [Actinokineospora bangkokensis]OLR91262.1 hypothetical protein BJP25_26695 [Actinokineospora bangkokensis]
MTRQPRLDDLLITVAGTSVLITTADRRVGGGATGVLHGDRRVLSRIDVECPGQVETRRSLTPTSLVEDITVTGGAGSRLRVVLASDLAGVEDIKSGAEPVSVDPSPPLQWAAGGIGCVVTAPGARVEGSSLVWDIGEQHFTARWSATFHDASGLHHSAGKVVHSPTTSHPRLSTVVTRGVDDLNALALSDGENAFAAAGAPWYLTLFGRDSIWAARLALPVSLDLAAGTLRALARLQGREHDPATAEEPGKIPHELRRGPFELDGMRLPALYYGTVDATPLWACLLHDAWRAGLPDDQVRELLPALKAALAWTAGHDTFLRYVDRTGTGLANQGWKDSPDAVRFPDGTRAAAPIALCEVQSYAHEALTRGADLLDAFGEPDPSLRERAARLRADFRAAFWVDGFPALAVDGTGRPVGQVTSNAGHLVGTGLLTREEEALVVARLRRPDLLGPFGLRTLSTGSAVHDPLSYHCGSTWPHDTAITARALAADFPEEAADIALRLLAAADRDGELPELLGGQVTRTPYPSSCHPQAWSAAAGVSVLWRLLGLEVDVPARVLRVRPPRPLPLGPFEAAGIRLAGGELSVRVGDSVEVDAPAGFEVRT